MRRLARLCLLLACLLPSEAAWAQSAFVQGASNQGNNLTTLTVTLPGNGTSGNYLVCVVSFNAAHTMTSTVYGGSLSLTSNGNISNTGARNLYIMSAQLASASTSIVVTPSASTRIEATCGEFTNPSSSTPLDGTTASYQADAVTNTNGQVNKANSAAPAFMVAGVSTGSANTFTPPTDYTAVTSTNSRTAMAYRILSDTGTRDSNWSFTSDEVTALHASYLSAAAAGATLRSLGLLGVGR